MILPVYRNPPMLCYRNLLYTAVTRPSPCLSLWAAAQAVAEMVNNNRKTLRYSGLGYFLKQTEAIGL